MTRRSLERIRSGDVGTARSNRFVRLHRSPVHTDVPATDAVFLPAPDDETRPSRAKGLGRLGALGAGASAARAVHNATGIRICDHPLTLDKVLEGFEEQEGRPPRRN